MKLPVLRNSLLLIFLITVLTQGQFRRRPDFLPQLSTRGIYFESIIVPEDSGAMCYLPFRISYSSLVFIKEGQLFKAKYSITAEASDSTGNLVLRDIISKEIIVDSYEKTLDENTYSQGLLKIRMPHGTYSVTPLFTDVNASKEQPVRKITVRTKSDGSGIYDPVLIRSKGICDSIFTQIVNFEGQIPFSNDKFDLLIPIQDSTVNRINIEVINNNKSIMNTTLDEFFAASLELVDCKDNIQITSRTGNNSTRYFIYHYFNRDLTEGKLEIKISKADKAAGTVRKSDRSFSTFVRWFDKPFSLVNVPFSIRILKYITDEQTVDDLIDKDEEKQYEALTEYWKKMDPTPGSAFNELMKEYYERVDYTIKNFSAVGSKNGAETDRGKIFIQFGKPDNINRIYDDPENTKEVWTYKNPERQFMFTDKTGLGNFILSSNL